MGKDFDKEIRELLDRLTLEDKFYCLGTRNPEIQAAGLPEFGVGGEGAHGVQARHDQHYDTGAPCKTTVFTNPIGMSATWDRELIKEAGNVVGKEARGLYQSKKHRALSLWAPTIDMGRDPRWGRTEECYGEDPYLTGEMAGAYVSGIQGEDENYLQCGTTLKHFYANNKEEGRTYISSSVDSRNREEYYLEPFRKVIEEYHATGVMTAYNEVNGTPAMLLKDEIQKAKRWGDIHVVCDGGDVNQTVNFHKYYSRHAQTIASGLDAGIDCFTDDIYMVAEAAKEAYDNGLITEEDIDRALYSYFKMGYRLGVFGEGSENPFSKISEDVVACRAHGDVARRVAEESVVLLKNEENILPLNCEDYTCNGKKLALIGPLSDEWFKDWYGGLPPYTVSVLDGIKEIFGIAGKKSDSMPKEPGVVHATESAVDVTETLETDAATEEGDCENTCTKNRTLLYENGISEMKIYLPEYDRYLGILEDGKTVGIVSAESAEVFQFTYWDGDQITIRAKSNGKLLTTEDDPGIGQIGTITATKDEAFGWFVRERFHLQYMPEHLEMQLYSWDEKPLSIDSEGRLRKVEKLSSESIFSLYNGHSWETEKMNTLTIRREMVRNGLEEAANAATQADVAVVCLGAHPMITCKEEIDRPDLALPQMQLALLREVSRTGVPVVLVLLSSVPYDLSEAERYASAILTCAQGSMELGHGVCDILFGKKSPAGRLPMTWYPFSRELPDLDEYDIIQGKRTYQYDDGKVLYPFGYGLSYTTFSYSGISVNETNLSDETWNEKGLSMDKTEFFGERAGQIQGSFYVENTGKMIGDEVVQVYTRKVPDKAQERVHLQLPLKKLAYFERVKDLQPGEKRQIIFALPIRSLMYYDVVAEEMRLSPGKYEIMVGASSEDIRLRTEITLSGEDYPLRDGWKWVKADSYHKASGHVLHEGEFALDAVCTKEEGTEATLCYSNMVLSGQSKEAKHLVLDFWIEHHCELDVEIKGMDEDCMQPFRLHATIPAANEFTDGEQNDRPLVAGEATGLGAVDAHKCWLTVNREIGFREVRIPLDGRILPARLPFEIQIQWQGLGKLCMFRFE